MKAGITSYGAYVPYNRIERSTMAAAWNGKGGRGEVSVAGSDEDALTMAVEASLHALAPIEAPVDKVSFATVTAPYAELGQAAILASACDLAENIRTDDYSSSLRAGLSAMLGAADAVAAGSASCALVAAADCRKAWPKSPKEQMLGDAAAAFTFGSKEPLALLEDAVSVSNEIIDSWRNYGEVYLNTAEGRFATDMGYNASMKKAVGLLLEKQGFGPAAITTLVLTTPGPKDADKLAAKLGFAPEQLADTLMNAVGDCGTAQGPLLLALALEKAKPGDKILLAAYGSGADALLFTVTDAITSYKGRGQVLRTLATKRALASYSQFLSFKNILATVPGEPFRTFPSNAAYYRDRKSILRFRGSKCNHCGAEIFPIQRVCHKCGATDDYTEQRLVHRKARVFTYSVDRLAGRSDDPVVVQTVSEDDAGVRYYNLMTDFDEDKVAAGMEVEFTFRKIYEGGNYNNYFWKCRPVRDTQEGGETK